jgi:hypothetical protein
MTPAVADMLARGPAAAADMARALAVSQATLSRSLRALEAEKRVLRIGSTHGARYALRRRVDAIGDVWPMYQIDEEGTPRELGPLHAIERESYFATSVLPRLLGIFEGLPYYFQDTRPGGFLGRAVPAAYPELELPARVIDWTDTHVLVYLSRRGSDTVGNLILGTEALDRHLANTHAPQTVQADARGTRYPALADAAMAGAPPGSSAHGEHPKFTCCVAEGASRTHMIVKFSPPRTTPIGQRWADLLIGEHLAHRILEEQGIAACRSSILDHGNRIFLECERFDRVGAAGRRGAVSLFAVDTTRYGNLDNWTASSERLVADRLLSAEDAGRIRLLDAFGALIANTDRHFGNITLFDRYEGQFELAPAYDMLPMLFAPQSDQLVERVFVPATPTAAWLSVWPRARSIAEAYWDRLAQDERVSREFRGVCTQCLQAIQASPLYGARSSR